MPKLQYSQIILSYKYKVLSQNKSWDSIPSLGLHLIQREIFSSLHNPPQNPLQRDLSFLHFATKLAHIEQNNITSEYLAPYIYTKQNNRRVGEHYCTSTHESHAWQCTKIPKAQPSGDKSDLESHPYITLCWQRRQKREVITCKYYFVIPFYIHALDSSHFLTGGTARVGLCVGASAQSGVYTFTFI